MHMIKVLYTVKCCCVVVKKPRSPTNDKDMPSKTGRSRECCGAHNLNWKLQFIG